MITSDPEGRPHSLSAARPDAPPIDVCGVNDPQHLLGMEWNVGPSPVIAIGDQLSLPALDQAVCHECVSDSEYDQLPQARPWFGRNDLDLAGFGKRGAHAVSAKGKSEAAAARQGLL
jgi:hypothetical protein